MTRYAWAGRLLPLEVVRRFCCYVGIGRAGLKSRRWGVIVPGTERDQDKDGCPNMGCCYSRFGLTRSPRAMNCPSGTPNAMNRVAHQHVSTCFEYQPRVHSRCSMTAARGEIASLPFQWTRRVALMLPSSSGAEERTDSKLPRSSLLPVRARAHRSRPDSLPHPWAPGRAPRSQCLRDRLPPRLR